MSQLMSLNKIIFIHSRFAVNDYGTLDNMFSLHVREEVFGLGYGWLEKHLTETRTATRL